MTVDVTAADIAGAFPCQCTLCPVARALERVTGEPWFVLEDRARPVYSHPDAYTDLPPEVADRVRAYDAGADMDPFEFEFDYPAATDADRTGTDAPATHQETTRD